MPQSQHPQWLFTALVALCFATIIGVWIQGMPVFFTEFSDEVRFKSKESQKTIETEFKKVQAQLNGVFEKETSAQSTSTSDIPASISSFLASQVSGVLSKSGTSSLPSLILEEYRTNCSREGGFHQERKKGKSFEYGVCVFSDGSECEEELFFRGKCHKGQYAVAEDGIPRKPDLGFATADKQTVIQNRGWAKSTQSTLSFRGKTVQIPALSSGEIIDMTATLSLENASNEFPAVIDEENVIEEIHEDNNRYPIEQKQ